MTTNEIWRYVKLNRATGPAPNESGPGISEGHIILSKDGAVSETYAEIDVSAAATIGKYCFTHVCHALHPS